MEICRRRQRTTGDFAGDIRKEKRQGMGLRIEQMQLPAPLGFNYEEIKKYAIEKAETYKSLVYDDKQIAEAKNDRSSLRKLRDALNRARIDKEQEIKKALIEPFKNKVDEIIRILDEPIDSIDKQIKAFEEDQKAEKRTQIGALWENIPHPDWLTLPKLFDEKWLNKTASMKSIEETLKDKVEQINKDLDTVKALGEFSFEAESEYKRTLDLTQAIAEGKRLADIQKAKLEQMKAAEPPAPAPEAVKVEETGFMREIGEEEPRMWVSFQAYLTITQAKELKAFFNDRGIEFKAV